MNRFISEKKIDFVSVLNRRDQVTDEYSPVHETRIRINYTYYNSPDIFFQICDWYQSSNLDDCFDFTVIDDGSQIHPITDLDVPDFWTVLRIDEDLGWNNEGARNCLMRHTTNRWNLVMDSDWVITKQNLFKIRRHIDDMPRDQVYLPSNFGANTIRNSYLVTREEFWRRGGYDQAFIGYHGNDYSFLRLNESYDKSDWFAFTRLVDDVMDPDDKNRYNEIVKFHKHMDDLEARGAGYRNKEDRQDFDWTNKKMHKEHWKDITYRQVK